MAAMNMNTKIFNEKVMEGNKPVLVEFSAPWCVYCRRIAPVMIKVAEQYSESLVVGEINIDEESELAQKEQIEVIPTLVLYKNGQSIGSIVAPESKAKIDAFIKETLGE